MSSPRRHDRWPTRGLIRPAGVSKPAVSLGAICVALFITAITTGAGWLLVLLALIAGLLAVAIIGPAILLVRVDVDADAPRDAVAGRPVTVSLRVRRIPAPVAVRATLDADATPTEWHGAAPGRAGGLVVTPTRRGPVEHVRVEVRTAAPLGLVRWRRRLAADLTVPLAVAPVPLPVSRQRIGAGTHAETASRTHRHAGPSGLTRSVRDYVPGDPLNQVHWAASARHGDVVVREFDVPARPAVVIVVDLGDGSVPDDAVERCASLAAGHAAAALDDGADVVLATTAADGLHVTAVTSPREAGRALAFAVPGPPPAVPRQADTEGADRIVVRAAAPGAPGAAGVDAASRRRRGGSRRARPTTTTQAATAPVRGSR